jgi:hypothetical protein
VVSVILPSLVFAQMMPPLHPSISYIRIPHHSADRQVRGISCCSAIGSLSTNSRHSRNSRLFLFRGITHPVLPYLPPVPRSGARPRSPQIAAWRPYLGLLSCRPSGTRAENQHSRKYGAVLKSHAALRFLQIAPISTTHYPTTKKLKTRSFLPVFSFQFSIFNFPFPSIRKFLPA